MLCLHMPGAVESCPNGDVEVSPSNAEVGTMASVLPPCMPAAGGKTHSPCCCRATGRATGDWSSECASTSIDKRGSQSASARDSSRSEADDDKESWDRASPKGIIVEERADAASSLLDLREGLWSPSCLHASQGLCLMSQNMQGKTLHAVIERKRAECYKYDKHHLQTQKLAS